MRKVAHPVLFSKNIAQRALLFGSVCASLLLAAPPAKAILREVMAGQSALPAASGNNVVKTEEIVATFQKGGETALSPYEEKPLRIRGQVKGFNADLAINHDQDLLVFLSPEESPVPVCVRFARKQFQSFCLPADKKPPITDSRYTSFVRTLNQAHTIAYFNRDINAITLFYSEMLTPPGQAATTPPVIIPKGGPTKDVFVPFTADRIPLVSVGDSFDADVEFEQICCGNMIVFKSTAPSYVPPPMN